MSPRPRQVSDDEILAAALRVIVRRGPGHLTLREVGREAGVTAGALVQRFGSKRRILLALAEQGPEANRMLFEGLRAAHPSPVRALRALADCMAQLGETPEEIANSLAFLQIDLTDAEFHGHALASSTVIREGIRGLLLEAQRAGELRGLDPRRLAGVVQAALNGSLLNWAIHREGDLRSFVRRDLEALLGPYQVRSGVGPARRDGVRRRPKRRPARKPALS